MIIKTYQKSHLAHLFSPNLSQESANRRLRRWIIGDQKLCEELRKVGFFDHQRDHFFTKKEVELLFEYIGEPCNWLNINILNNSRCQRCQGVKVSNSFRATKFAYKLYLKYIYILKVQNDIFGDVLWHFDTLTLWHHVVSLLMLFPKNIVFGNNLYAFWHNQHKLPYRCSGYLQLPRSFGVRKENPAANKSNERIRRTKAHRNACRQKRLRLQDIYQILQKGVKAQRFHTLFSFTLCLP